MRISVLGTGQVGRGIAARLSGLGHEVVVGTRDPAATLARAEPDAMGTPPYRDWLAEHPVVPLVPAPAAGEHAEVLVNATGGAASVEALRGAGVGERDGLVVLDVANPLDFSGGGPLPNLDPAVTDSLGERIQRAFPAARVVKALNTMNGAVMVDPASVPGTHVVFVAGDDAAAKATVSGLLAEIGWPDGTIVDLGGIVAARGTEAYLLLWLATARALGTFTFNIGLAR